VNETERPKSDDVAVLVGNPVMPDVFRIVYGDYDEAMQFALEMNDLSKVPAYFTIEHACLIRSLDLLQSAAGAIFGPNEVVAGSDFWVIRPAQAIALMQVASVGDVTEDFRAEYNGHLDMRGVPDLNALRPRIVPPELDFRALTEAGAAGRGYHVPQDE
jgi:hypothetical protein